MSSDAPVSFERHPVNRLNAAGAPDFVTIEARRLLDEVMGEAHAELLEDGSIEVTFA